VLEHKKYWNGEAQENECAGIDRLTAENIHDFHFMLKRPKSSYPLQLGSILASVIKISTTNSWKE
jgi:hypothetical protein